MPTPAPNNNDSHVDPLIVIIILAVVFFASGGKMPSGPTKPTTNSITASPATITACAPIKQAVAATDSAKRQRLSSAFAALAVTLAAAGDDVKTTGRLSDLIQKFSTVVTKAEPDLAGILPATTNTAFTTAFTNAFASVAGTGVDKPITKEQAADFAAGIADALK